LGLIEGGGELDGSKTVFGIRVDLLGGLVRGGGRTRTKWRRRRRRA